MNQVGRQASSSSVLEQQLDSYRFTFIVAAFVISLGIVLPRFGPGIPMSVDTNSHLYRILFFSRWLNEGIYPFWSPDWYAGAPALLLYPPLGYFLALGLSTVGLDPLLSYKIIDAIFYLLAPFTVYFLGRELGFSKGESAVGSLFFSVLPGAIENYLFFDRFPTVISIPIFCAFVIMFHRTLANLGGPVNLLGAIFSMSALMLTHHLSALIAGIVAVLMVLLSAGRQGWAKSITLLVVVAVGTVGLTAFWFVPFLQSLTLFAANPFFNRNVTFPFIRFEYFGFDVGSYLLGIAQFVLAAVAVASILGRAFGRRIPVSTLVFFGALLAGMMFFQVGELVRNQLFSAFGQFVIIVSFVGFLSQLLLTGDARRIIAQRNGAILAVLWFVVFLWIGLGYHALPILWLPYLSEFWIKTMDVYRIWLYLAFPMSILAARGLIRSLARLWTNTRVAALLLLTLTILPITVGAILKVNYAYTHSVNLVLPYSTANSYIPGPIIDYFRNDPSSGRILGINVPFWIYVLPNYVDKPIIDGWYPQSKLIPPLSEGLLSDYRLDDLETAPNWPARMVTWQSLIANYDLFDIAWVMIGNRTISNQLMQNSATLYTEQVSVMVNSAKGEVEIVVYKAVKAPSYVETGAANLDYVTVARPNPDKIILTLNSSLGPTEVLVKEAYFPTWAAESAGRSLRVQRVPGSGYILLQLPPGTTQVTLYQNTDTTIWTAISAVSLVTYVGIAAMMLVGKRKAASTNDKE